MLTGTHEVAWELVPVIKAFWRQKPREQFMIVFSCTEAVVWMT